MNQAQEVIILIADDDAGHARLIEKNITRAGLHNQIERFQDGQAILDFLFRRGGGPRRQTDVPYLLLLDLRMPRVDVAQDSGAQVDDDRRSARSRALPRYWVQQLHCQTGGLRKVCRRDQASRALYFPGGSAKY
jgi:CheY-like chemotaxis protein